MNIAEILKDCPKGTKLYSPLLGECELKGINQSEIFVEQGQRVVSFNKYGKYWDVKDSECILFPSKENRDWSKFQRPFKDGDVISNGNTIAIFKKADKPYICFQKDIVYYHCWYNLKYSEFKAKIDYGVGAVEDYKYATKKEKQKLFDVIKEKGYCWNAETKTLEKLVEPKFKVGDVIKDENNLKWKIISISDHFYEMSAVSNDILQLVEIDAQYDYELIPNKFNISTLKPFDKVLVRDSNDQFWSCELFESYSYGDYPFNCLAACYSQCIPYEDNEYLLVKSDDCDEYFKTWK